MFNNPTANSPLILFVLTTNSSIRSPLVTKLRWINSRLDRRLTVDVIQMAPKIYIYHSALSPHIYHSSRFAIVCVSRCRTGLRTSWSASLVCSRLPRSAAFFVSGKLPPGVWSDAGGDTRRLPTPLPAPSSCVTVPVGLLPARENTYGHLLNQYNNWMSYN